MLNEIDKIQLEIDKLNELCPEPIEEAVGTDWNDIKPRRREQLGIMILKLLDGVLPPRHLLKLEKWLAADAAAQRYYVDYMKLTVMLSLYYNPDRLKTPNLSEVLHK